jgi:hypothetical protein
VRYRCQHPPLASVDPASTTKSYTKPAIYAARHSPSRPSYGLLPVVFGGETAILLLAAHLNLLVVRTMSKSRGTYQATGESARAIYSV